MGTFSYDFVGKVITKMEPRDFVRLSGLDLVNVLRNNYVNWYISRHFSRRYKNLPPLTLQPFWVEIP